jgi:hypothetical protein
MTSKRLHELEQVSQGIHNAVAEIKDQHADVDLSAIEDKLNNLDAILTAWAEKLDTPDEPVM